MNIRELHEWNVTTAEARQIQDELRSDITLVDTIRLADVRLIAGADNGYEGRGARTVAWAAVVVMTFPDLNVVETRVTSQHVTFPYVPGLLSFREAPALLEAFRQIESIPDVVVFDAQGYAHPRRLGAASHLGLFLDVPTIGCAKSRLVGTYVEPGAERGARSALIDNDEIIGTVLRSRTGQKPLFVSPGHRLSVDTAADIVFACCVEGKFMPEPTRLADRIVREAKQDATTP